MLGNLTEYRDTNVSLQNTPREKYKKEKKEKKLK